MQADMTTRIDFQDPLLNTVMPLVGNAYIRIGGTLETAVARRASAVVVMVTIPGGSPCCDGQPLATSWLPASTHPGYANSGAAYGPRLPPTAPPF